MSTRLYINNFSTKLTAQLLVGGTTANITNGDGASLAGANGANWIVGTLRRMSGFRDVAREIVKISNRSSDALTIVRAQEGTTALQFEIGDQLDVDFTAASFADAIAGSASTPITSAGGTVDAITATYSPAITLSNEVLVAVVAGGANATATPTFAPNGLTAHTIVKHGGQPLVAGDIAGAGYVALLEYNLAGTRWELLNPATSSGGSGTVTVLSAGSLTANGVVLGAGTTQTKTVDGIASDGTSKLQLGGAGALVGKVELFNATSGSVTLQPVTGALGTVTVSVPAATDTLVGKATTDTLTNKSIDAAQLTGTVAVARFNSGSGASGTTYLDGTGAWTTPAGAGTVTVLSSGSLTANGVVLGAGTTETKTVDGISSDGTSVINLGSAGSLVGGVVFGNATSGTITLKPTTGALGSAQLSMPAATDTLVGKATTDTLTNKSIDAAQLTGTIAAARIPGLNGTVVDAAAYNATLTVDLSTYSRYAKVILDTTLTGACLFNLTNGTDGQIIEWRARQDATGSRVLTSGANIRFGTDITATLLTTTASKMDRIAYEWNSTDSKADVVAFTKGY